MLHILYSGSTPPPAIYSLYEPCTSTPATTPPCAHRRRTTLLCTPHYPTLHTAAALPYSAHRRRRTTLLLDFTNKLFFKKIQ